MDEVRHGPHCDADLRHDGCVCAETPTIEEQYALLSAFAAEWAEREAKRQTDETDRLGWHAFGGDAA